jgi:hypothetical protein
MWEQGSRGAGWGRAPVAVRIRLDDSSILVRFGRLSTQPVIRSGTLEAIRSRTLVRVARFLQQSVEKE